ncbi:tetratricopeptide repeat protein [Marinobacterium jannaschii]|uniref:tetratricopeptide repeat protein n=1 Tax=Marinobacterium jannaschii TaxID=64970 RepID=UPI00048306D4|nr:tetratricopeptide repeat protein [Marinobacterium jannaschii]
MKKHALLAASLLLSLQATYTLAADLGKATRAFDQQDYSVALDELKPLAKEGNHDASNMLGQMYENGWGVDKDLDQAKRLYTRGANIGHLDSVNSLRGLKNKEYQKELVKVRQDAESGNAAAQNRLGVMYEFGYGVKRSPEIALDWYRKAADKNYVAALHNIGRCYNFGTGVAQNFSEAETWYRKAAEQGHTEAMFFLGTLYSNDHGRERAYDSNIIAYAWMHNASELGNETAAAIEKRLVMKLSESELKTAQALANDYQSRYVAPYKN